MTHHTPGPWAVEPYPYDGEPVLSGEYSIVSGDKKIDPIATIDVAGRPHGEVQANALLIGEAPNLLLALQNAWGIVTAAKHIVEKSGGPAGELERAWVQISTAVTRATGDHHENT